MPLLVSSLSESFEQMHQTKLTLRRNKQIVLIFKQKSLRSNRTIYIYMSPGTARDTKNYAYVPIFECIEQHMYAETCSSS